MLTLITYPPAFGQPSASPFCVKAEYLLNASGLAWQREDSNDPRKAPRAKFPVLRTAEGLIHDSDAIRLYLESNGARFDAGLSGDQLALSHALRRMAEEHLYFLLVLDRWGRDEVWPIVRDTYFKEIPGLLRGLISSGLRKTLMKGMKAQGLGRFDETERMERAEQDFEAIIAILERTPYLCGDTASSVDASMAAILGAIRATPVDTPLSTRVAKDATLQGYIDRVHGRWGTSGT